MGDLSRKISIIFKLKKEIKNWKSPILYYFKLKNEEDIIEFKNGLKCIIRNKSDAIAFLEVFFLNTNDWIDEFKIKEKDIVIDIGAHVGYFSIHSSINAKNGKIFAFEPYDKSFEILMKNLNINKIKNVIPENLGVSKDTGTSILYLKKDFSIGNSIYKNSNLDLKIDIKTISVQDIIKKNDIQKIDILKLDCEGAEYEILLNLEQETLLKIKKIVSEMHPNIENFEIEQVKKFLIKNGFDVKIIHPLKDISEELVMLYAKNQNIK
jgi:FkbM family methyltransferase|tara:strand:+ start:3121 stop:3918 length:798 start_codon:yes stop_codon:yes gene_type:complete